MFADSVNFPSEEEEIFRSRRIRQAVLCWVRSKVEMISGPRVVRLSGHPVVGGSGDLAEGERAFGGSSGWKWFTNRTPPAAAPAAGHLADHTKASWRIQPYAAMLSRPYPIPHSSSCSPDVQVRTVSWFVQFSPVPSEKDTWVTIRLFACR